jgi:2-dehydropantoate 2-reductase
MADARDILVWGAGAIGGTVAACLARAGHRVTCVDTAAAHCAAIANDGLRISGPVENFTARVTAVAPEAVQGTWPLAIFAVKAHHSVEAAAALGPHLAPNGVVVTLQNGLSHVDVAKVLGEERVYACMVGFAADVLEPGHVRFGKGGDLAVGRPGRPVDAKLAEIVDVLRAFEPRTVATDRIEAFLWGKLGFVAILYGTTVGMSPLAVLLRDPQFFPLWHGLARELMAVAGAEGIDPEPFDDFDLTTFHPDAPPDLARRCLAITAAGIAGPNAKPHSGMWRDLNLHKRRTEIDAQLVPIVRLGRRHGLPCRLLDRVCSTIHDIEAGRRVQSDATIHELLAYALELDRSGATQSLSSVSR